MNWRRKNQKLRRPCPAQFPETSPAPTSAKFYIWFEKNKRKILLDQSDTIRHKKEFPLEKQCSSCLCPKRGEDSSSRIIATRPPGDWRTPKHVQGPTELGSKRRLARSARGCCNCVSSRTCACARAQTGAAKPLLQSVPSPEQPDSGFQQTFQKLHRAVIPRISMDRPQFESPPKAGHRWDEFPQSSPSSPPEKRTQLQGLYSPITVL